MRKFTLTLGRRYIATLKLGFFKGLASNDTIAAKLLDAGFVNVTVRGDGRTRSAFGEWGGATKEVELPDEVEKVEEL